MKSNKFFKEEPNNFEGKDSIKKEPVSTILRIIEYLDDKREIINPNPDIVFKISPPLEHFLRKKYRKRKKYQLRIFFKNLKNNKKSSNVEIILSDKGEIIEIWVYPKDVQKIENVEYIKNENYFIYYSTFNALNARSTFYANADEFCKCPDLLKRFFSYEAIKSLREKVEEVLKAKEVPGYQKAVFIGSEIDKNLIEETSYFFIIRFCIKVSSELNYE